jgi:hypothetical protein
VAAQNGKVEVLDNLWEWAKEFITPKDVSNNLFLEKDDSERTSWHVAQIPPKQNCDRNYGNWLNRI